MLSVQEKKQRLEELLARVRRNRIREDEYESEASAPISTERPTRVGKDIIEREAAAEAAIAQAVAEKRRTPFGEAPVIPIPEPVLHTGPTRYDDTVSFIRPQPGAMPVIQKEAEPQLRHAPPPEPERAEAPMAAQEEELPEQQLHTLPSPAPTSLEDMQPAAFAPEPAPERAPAPAALEAAPTAFEPESEPTIAEQATADFEQEHEVEVVLTSYETEEVELEVPAPVEERAATVEAVPLAEATTGFEVPGVLAADAAEPVTAVPEPIQTFAAQPTTSGDIAVVIGTPAPRSWALSAVLDRAFGFGSSS